MRKERPFLGILIKQERSLTWHCHLLKGFHWELKRQPVIITDALCCMYLWTWHSLNSCKASKRARNRMRAGLPGAMFKFYRLVKLAKLRGSKMGAFV